jgi:hypothetical protein
MDKYCQVDILIYPSDESIGNKNICQKFIANFALFHIGHIKAQPILFPENRFVFYEIKTLLPIPEKKARVILQVKT